MKIHHTNRTMNATFNLKRFLLLEQYKRNETGRHLLWSAAVVSFICILCILYDINRGGSYYGKHTSATEFSRYVLWFILIAPACWKQISANAALLSIYCCRHRHSRSSCISG